MEFNTQQAIYLQIAELVCEKIIRGFWRAPDKIPSVRDLAAELEVNPNTVMRTYEFLQQMEILFNKRGLGFFVADEGRQKAVQHLRNEYMQQHLPQLYKNMLLLGIDPNEIASGYEHYKNLNQNIN